MAFMQKRLDAYQCYSLKSENKSPIGFVTGITLAGHMLPADQIIADPATPGQNIQVVAILNNFAWKTGRVDPILFEGFISQANRQLLSKLMATQPESIDLSFQFACYDFDNATDRYTVSLHTEKRHLQGRIEKEGSDLMLDVASSPLPMSEFAQTYAFTVGIKPTANNQELCVDTTENGKSSMAWG